MLSRVRDIKGSFISFCAKQAGMPLGRTAFQDFEIAYFLNAAYSKLVAQRVEKLVAMYEKLGEAASQHVEVERRDVYGGHILSELGTLYRPTFSTPELRGYGLIDDRKFKLWGPTSKIFEISKYNGCTPYVIGADLHEVPTGDNSDSPWSYTFPIRFISASDEIRYSLMFRGGDDLEGIPYRIARMRTVLVRDWLDLIDATKNRIMDALSAFLLGNLPSMDLLSDMTNFVGFQQLFIIELLHIPFLTPGELSLTIQMVVHPRPITEEELAQESERELEVTFGYEVSELAAQMAMAALTSGGQQPQPEA